MPRLSAVGGGGEWIASHRRLLAGSLDANYPSSVLNVGGSLGMRARHIFTASCEIAVARSRALPCLPRTFLQKLSNTPWGLWSLLEMLSLGALGLCHPFPSLPAAPCGGECWKHECRLAFPDIRCHPMEARGASWSSVRGQAVSSGQLIHASWRDGSPGEELPRRLPRALHVETPLLRWFLRSSLQSYNFLVPGIVSSCQT